MDMMQSDAPASPGELDLDIIGAILGTDKSSIVTRCWDFLRHYDRIFQPFRHRDINVIEIGVAGGHSLRMWDWYFSAATIVGVDINPTARRHATGRAQVAIGSQADAHFLRKLMRAHPPTIFIDDGSHLAEHNIFTFEQVFPQMLPGGFYVVEDLGLHLGVSAADWQGAVPRDAPAYFLDLARSCVARRHIDGAEAVPKQLAGLVDSVSFINGAAIIRKRGPAAGLDSAIAAAEAYMSDAAPHVGALERIALYIVRHGGSAAQAEAACELAIEAGSRALPLWCLYADTLLRAGREREAAEALVTGLSMPEQETKRRLEAAAHLSASGMTREVYGLLRDILESELGRVAARPVLDVLRGFRALA